VEIADVSMFHQLRESPEGDREDAAHEPEQVEVFINAVATESARGTNDAPDDARGKEGATVRTSEVVGLDGLTSILDVGQRPVHCCDLDETTPDRRGYLATEGDARWDLHVLGQFQIAAESLGVRQISYELSIDRTGKIHIPELDPAQSYCTP
jgi:hypothetical protein